jgi:hypothetical protein
VPGSAGGMLGVAVPFAGLTIVRQPVGVSHAGHCVRIPGLGSQDLGISPNSDPVSTIRKMSTAESPIADI